MSIDIDCPLCRHRMTALWDTEWTDGRQRTVDLLCERCLHRETIYLPIEKRKKESNGAE